MKALLMLSVIVSAVTAFVLLALRPGCAIREPALEPPAGSLLLHGAPAVEFQAHDSEVTCLAFSRDGRHLATAGLDYRLKLWRGVSGELLRTFSERNHWMNSIAFAPDGNLLAAGNRDGAVVLWDVHTGAEQAVLQPHTGFVWAVAFAPDGRTLAAGNGDTHTGGSPGGVTLWDVATRQATPLPLPRRAICTVAFSPDGATLAAADVIGQEVVLWDLPAGRERRRWEAHTSGLLRVAWSLDGRWLATASGSPTDNTVALWQADGRALQRRERGLSGVKALAWSPDSRLVAAAGLVASDRGSSCEIWLLTPDGRAPVRRLPLPAGRVQALAFTPDGTQLVGGCTDGRVRSWRVKGLL